MIRPDFSRLNMQLSDTKKASDSEVCWREFLVAVFNFINHCSYKVSEEDIADITKSLQNWTTNRGNKSYYERDTDGNRILGNINTGDIFLADLGMSYEFSYVHPVVVLDEVGNKLLVVPCSSSSTKLQSAFHHTSNPKGDRYLRKVFKQDGFDSECALLLNSIMIISKGRLLERKGRLNEDISKPDSIFNEVKDSIFEIYLGKQCQIYQRLVTENELLKQEIDNLKKRNFTLENIG